MAGNPVFSNFDKNLRSGQYAGFGGGQQQSYQQPYPQSGGMPQQGFPGQPTQGYGYPPQPGYGQQAPGYGAPGAPAQRRMTLDDVVMKSLALFGIVLVVAAGSWVVTSHSMDQGTGAGAFLWLGGMIVTLVLGFVIAMKKTISVPLIILYALAEGAFLGAVSAFFNARYPGVVGEAVLATLCVFGGVLVGYRSGLIKVTSRSRRIFMYMLIGYTLFALVNFVLVMTGMLSGFGVGGSGALGIAISLFAVALASYSLAVDFDSIENGVAAGVPEKTSWLLAYGLMVSVVWLYVEMLRLLSRLRD